MAFFKIDFYPKGIWNRTQKKLAVDLRLNIALKEAT
jgi:hypothetical protein